MKVKIATVSCGIEVNCLGVFTNSPKSEVAIIFKDNSKLVITEDHAFSVSDQGNFIFLSEEDYDKVFRELRQTPDWIWQ